MPVFSGFWLMMGKLSKLQRGAAQERVVRFSSNQQKGKGNFARNRKIELDLRLGALKSPFSGAPRFNGF
jgi:hypothetical protein